MAAAGGGAVTSSDVHCFLQFIRTFAHLSMLGGSGWRPGQLGLGGGAL